MRRRSFHVLGSILAVGLAACSSSNSPAPTPLTLTATIETGGVSTVTNGIKANGTSTVTIQVSGGTAAPIHVTAGRGQFAGGGSTATINAMSGSVELVVCDARTDSTCAGNVVVSALDANQGYGEMSLTFIGFEASCTNGGDSNHDGRVGCADPDCDTKGCTTGGTSGTCTSGVCVPPVCTPTADAEICNNGIDDDCDGKTDCLASACDGQPCKPGFPTFVCRSQACTDVGSGFAVTVTPARARIPADGLATDLITVTVTKAAAPQGGVLVDFTTDLGDFVGATSATTGLDGTATVTFRSTASGGTAMVKAALHDVPQVSQTAFVAMPVLGSIALGTIQNQVMGVKFSGFREQNQITVLLLDTDQKPYPDGLAVRFEHQQLGGTTISTPLAPDTDTCMASHGCIAFIGKTASPIDKPDTTGLASVNLNSGTAAGPVAIGVTATAGLADRNFTVQNIAIVGAKASGAHISLDCTPKNVPALTESDCSNSFYAGDGSTITCTVFLADRFNNVLGVATRADFRSEAGSAGPPVSTKDFDPTKGGDQSADLGHASDSVLVTGYRVPIDVTPLANEFSATYTSDCGTLEHNPRDGLGTVIVATQGEEGFVDLNGNGVYDTGEPFIDTGEPFVDENDNNTWDPGEPFIDVNQNGKWDGPNGTWDSDTVIWAETRVLYTSAALEVRWLDPADDGLLPAATPVQTFTVAGSTPGPSTSETFEVFTTDENFNPTSPTGTTYLSKDDAASGSATVGVLLPASTRDNLGMSFVQQFCDKQPPDDPTVCASVCSTAPCFRVTKISSFQYGSRQIMSLTGTKAGPDDVSVTATVNNILVRGTILGTVN